MWTASLKHRPVEPAVLLQIRLMPLARKRLLALLPELVPPLIEHPLRHAQLMGEFGNRPIIALAQAHGLQLELPRVSALLRHTLPLFVGYGPCLFFDSTKAGQSHRLQGDLQFVENSMRITICTIGTRGDVQPFVALGAGLAHAGHHVRIVITNDFIDLIDGEALEAVVLPVSIRGFMKRAEFVAALRTQQPLTIMRAILRLGLPYLERLADTYWHACQGSDAIIFSGWAVGAFDSAEKLGIPSFCAYLIPASPTTAFPHPDLISTNQNPVINRLSYLVEEQLLWRSGGSKLNAWRKSALGLPPIKWPGIHREMRSRHVPILFGYSPLLVPRPHDWPEWYYVTGYWLHRTPESWHPPAALLDFLASGPRPIYVGFGSMVDDQADTLMELIVEALNQTGNRAIISPGWSGSTRRSFPDTIAVVDAVPHDWLLPQTAAAIHHGGAGTISASIHAGVPSITIPFMLDQFTWSQRIAELGLGSKPIPRAEVTVDALVKSIQSVMGNEGMRIRATVFKDQLQSENGIERAVEVITQHIAAKVCFSVP